MWFTFRARATLNFQSFHAPYMKSMSKKIDTVFASILLIIPTEYELRIILNIIMIFSN